MAEVTDWNKKIIEEFRANAGRVGGQFEGAPLLLLHTVGARTGQERVNPMMYRAVGDSYAVFASKAGAPTNPDWYHNLRANPAVTVELGDSSYRARAVVTTGEERDRLYRVVSDGTSAYEQNTDRIFPVIILEGVPAPG